MENSLIKIGRLNKSFGLKGHIRAFVNPEILPRLKKLESVFLLSKSNPLPYFLDEFDLSESGHCMFHFEEIKDKTSADALTGKDIFIDQKFLKKIKPYSSLGDYIGFKLLDEQLGDLGILENVTEMLNHNVGHFTYHDKEVLFPWNEQVIMKIDKKKKEISVNLPEGLLDIYL